MSGQSSTNNPWFQHGRCRADAKLRLLCFPYAGGSARIYKDWAAAAPLGIDVLPVQLPGRFNRLQDPAHTELNALIQDMLATLMPILDRPFALFGHSMGALISFEFARVLRERVGLQPMRLFVSGRYAPHLPSPRPPVHQLSDPDLIEELRRLQGTPQEVLEHPQLLEIALPLLRADFQLCETYRYVPKPSLACSITGFAGLQDEHCPPSAVQAWQEQSEGGFDLHVFEGDHFFLHPFESSVRGHVFRSLKADMDGVRPHVYGHMPNGIVS